MDFLELCNTRHSVRDYLPTPVSKDKLDYVLECAQLAPSAVNFQPWQFIVVTGENGREKLHECYHRDWFKTAPCYIIIVADHSQSWKRKVDGRDFGDVDAAIATEHICLAAASIGLGTCWVCNFDPDVLRENFQIAPELEAVAIVPLGYPAGTPETTSVPKSRKPLNEIVRWEKL